MSREVPATEAAGAAATTLRKNGLRNDQESDEHAQRCPHVSSAIHDRKGSAAWNALEARVSLPCPPVPRFGRVHMCTPTLRLFAQTIDEPAHAFWVPRSR
jgi:hypothetical protein